MCSIKRKMDKIDSLISEFRENNIRGTVKIIIEFIGTKLSLKEKTKFFCRLQFLIEIDNWYQ